MQKFLPTLLAAATTLLVACQSEPEGPQQWSELEGIPADFQDGKDDVRTDDEIRQAITETDPVFAASPAAAVSTEKLDQWSTAHGWGDHAAAGYLTAEADPAFAASTAALIYAEHLDAWNAAYGWGDHALAGYLTAESDPAFTASPVASVSTGDLANWNSAYAWGNHAASGYLTSESDPKVGALSTGAVPKWDGTQLVDGAISEANGKVAIGAAPGTATLTVSNLAKFGVRFSSGTTKSCSMSGFEWTHTPPSASACTTYCTSRGFVGGAVGATGSKTCGGASCKYVSDFETCATTTVQNNQNCDTCAQNFVCVCQEEGVELSGDVRVLGGNVGVGVSAPTSPLQISGYIQLGTTTGQPPAADCDHASERARMLVDPASNQLWICGNGGWVAK